jgi:hypothetical protein
MRRQSVPLDTLRERVGLAARWRHEWRWRDPPNRHLHPLREVPGNVATDDPDRTTGVSRHGHGKGDIHPLTGPDDDPNAGQLRRNADKRRRSRRRTGNSRLGGFPGVLDGRIADHGLMDDQTGVDDVQEDHLARNELEGRRDVRVVPSDQVDLAGTGLSARDQRGRQLTRLDRTRRSPERDGEHDQHTAAAAPGSAVVSHAHRREV